MYVVSKHPSTTAESFEIDVRSQAHYTWLGTHVCSRRGVSWCCSEHDYAYSCSRTRTRGGGGPRGAPFGSFTSLPVSIGALW